MTDPDFDKYAVRQAALALRAAIAAFQPGDSAAAKMVLRFVSNALPIDGAMQGYPELSGPYDEFSSQLRGIASVRRKQEIIRRIVARRESSRQPR